MAYIRPAIVHPVLHDMVDFAYYSCYNGPKAQLFENLILERLTQPTQTITVRIPWRTRYVYVEMTRMDRL